MRDEPSVMNKSIALIAHLSSLLFLPVTCHSSLNKVIFKAGGWPQFPPFKLSRPGSGGALTF
jgi:hypothetical protein